MANKKLHVLFLTTMAMAVLIMPSMADTALGRSYKFYDPLGDETGWSFEGSPNGWTTNNGGIRTGAQRLHGSSSWFTSGGGDYYMYRYVDSNHALLALRGHKVKFSFSFYPQAVASDGSINQARAEIYYEYYTSGGSCPYLNVWNGWQYALDNILLPRLESCPGEVVDYYMLQNPLVPVAGGLYRLLINELENEHSFFDYVELVAVDHPSNVNVAVNPNGEILTYAYPHPPVSAITDRHRNVKRLLEAVDENYYEGDKGSYITLNFGDELDASQSAKLVIRSDAVPQARSPIEIQTMNETGDWQTVATIYTRDYWSTDIIDLSEFLPDPKGSLKVRLCFVSNDKVDFIGLDVSPNITINSRSAQLISATHRKSGDPTINENNMESDVKPLLLHDDDVNAELLPGEQIELAFALQEKEAEANLVTDFIFISRGYYYTLPHGELIDPTVYGDWVLPVETKWYTPYLVVDLPDTTTSVKVIIHGKPDFKAYIDAAVLTITDVKRLESSYGYLSVALDIYSWRIEQGLTYDGVVLASVSLATAGKSGYYIYQTKLQTELLPDENTGKRQQGSLNIPYAAQANDKGHKIDYTETQPYNVWVSNIVSFGVKIAVGTAVGMVIPIATPVIIKAFAGTAATTAVMWALSLFESNPQQRSASYQAGTTTVWEQWKYPSYHSELEPCPFVKESTGSFDLTWQFDSDTAHSFKIKTTAYVNWAVSRYIPGHYGVDHWTLDPICWESQYTYLTVYAQT